MKSINATHLIPDLINSKVGLEVETHRINEHGELSRNDYPKGLLDEKQHHFIKNDFLETQSELITPPTTTTTQALKYLGAYHQALRGTLASSEYLWPYSMPPMLLADHSDIVIAKTDRDNYQYRKRVAQLRKISRTAETGVHVNVGLTDAALADLGIANDKAAIDAAYLQAAVGLMRYRWLLTYLFGATPQAFSHYFAEDTDTPGQPVRSLRNSHFGFGNGFLASYQSVADYVDQIITAVKNGQLIAEREYYGSVRLKRSPEIRDLLSQGIDYIEYRTFDLNPFEPYGISSDAINLIRLMFAYFVAEQPFDLGSADKAIATAEKMNETTALELPQTTMQYHDKAWDFIDRLQQFSADILVPFSAQRLCFALKEQIDNPALTPSARLARWSHGSMDTLFKLLMTFSKGYQDDLIHNPTIGFEKLTPTEQQAILEKLRQGTNVEIN
ncbi:glutamate--cysteine ligase [Lentilactobacillus fungorum]|uniref:Glutamate--cysteine ligase n=1 Tax=Lentilactobacillus fungorum TaxID=2201250 RepID=A0ABQ3W0M9_9LACO|nr:glutamate--cysteine ligase [Lentilactobacillus fungorum]GHP14213.1 glutamate--cysteine ligase [Lentilactobacillus fungorum]